MHESWIGQMLQTWAGGSHAHNRSRVILLPIHRSVHRRAPCSCYGIATLNVDMQTQVKRTENEVCGLREATKRCTVHARITDTERYGRMHSAVPEAHILYWSYARTTFIYLACSASRTSQATIHTYFDDEVSCAKDYPVRPNQVKFDPSGRLAPCS